jgi:GNAT superfamily N-acetyltransferase
LGAVTYHLVSLREQPQHLATVAGWVHAQWWFATDTPIDAIERWLGTHLGEDGFPATFIALLNDEPVGSASLHESEAEDRPTYKPYLGALFVKPSSRGHGLGAVLVRAVEAHAIRLGRRLLYLNAADALTPYYEALGWRIVERDYGRKRLNIMRRALIMADESPDTQS